MSIGIRTAARLGSLAAPGISLLLLAACAPATPPAPGASPGAAPAAPPAPAAPAGPQRGGELRVGSTTKTTSFNVYRDAGAGTNTTLAGPVYDNLIHYNYKPDVDWRKDLTDIAPQLATKWVQKEPTVYEFSLRDGAKWSDGSPVTAEDVVWSYTYWRDPKNAFSRASLLAAVDKIEAPDAKTVRFTLKAPTANFLPNLADEYSTILPKHVGEKGADFEKLEHLVGTGPFKVQSWDRDTRAVLVRNEAYWQGDRPFVDKITIYFGMDQSARLSAFVAKEIDVHYSTDEKTAQTVKASVPDMTAEPNIANTQPVIFINVGKKPFDDLRVRKALHLATDRQAMIKVVGGGKGQINPFGVWSGVDFAVPQADLLKKPGFREDKTQDLAEAKRLLAEAGYAGGLKTVLKTSSELVSTPPVQQTFVEQMKKIGVDLEDRQTDRPSFTKEFNAKEYDLSTWIMPGVDPDTQLTSRLLGSSASNVSNVQDATLDDLILKQRQAVEKGERTKLLRQLQDYLEEKVYIIPTLDIASWSLRQSYLKDWVDYRGVDAFMYAAETMWLDVAKMPKRS